MEYLIKNIELPELPVSLGNVLINMSIGGQRDFDNWIEEVMQAQHLKSIKALLEELHKPCPHVPGYSKSKCDWCLMDVRKQFMEV